MTSDSLVISRCYTPHVKWLQLLYLCSERSEQVSACSWVPQRQRVPHQGLAAVPRRTSRNKGLRRGRRRTTGEMESSGNRGWII